MLAYLKNIWNPFRLHWTGIPPWQKLKDKGYDALTLWNFKIQLIKMLWTIFFYHKECNYGVQIPSRRHAPLCERRPNFVSSTLALRNTLFFIRTRFFLLKLDVLKFSPSRPPCVRYIISVTYRWILDVNAFSTFCLTFFSLSSYYSSREPRSVNLSALWRPALPLNCLLWYVVNIRFFDARSIF